MGISAPNYIQEYVPAEILNLLNNGTIGFPNQTIIIYEWKHDFTHIDTLYIFYEFKIDNPGEHGFIRMYLDGVELSAGDPIDLDNNDWAYAIRDTDVSSITGQKVLKLTLVSPASGMFWRRVQAIIGRG